jgi:predicted SAM-dependent methyltransferase
MCTTLLVTRNELWEARMIPRVVKATYFTVARIPMLLSGRLYRHFRAPREGITKVHLGPGQKNYIKGWVNVDGNIVSATPDVWADLRDPLPFHSGTVDVFYSHHVIEHLPDAALPVHLAEMFRCLKPGGVIRIGGPNGDAAIRKFLEGEHEWFGDFPDSRSSIGGRFVNFILCRGEHLTILTQSYLEELLTAAGFSELCVCAPATETTAPELIGDEVLGTESEETPQAPHTLIIEARKPELADSQAPSVFGPALAPRPSMRSATLS